MATAVETPAAAKTKGRILIVDDELVVRDSLGKWFTSEGYTARPVGSGREALEAIQQTEFDIALLDIKMPGMDGMELQARLHEADPDLTVVIMTGYASVDTAVQALKRGRLRLHHQAGGSGRAVAPGGRTPWSTSARAARSGAAAREPEGGVRPARS